MASQKRQCELPGGRDSTPSRSVERKHGDPRSDNVAEDWASNPYNFHGDSRKDKVKAAVKKMLSYDGELNSIRRRVFSVAVDEKTLEGKIEKLAGIPERLNAMWIETTAIFACECAWTERESAWMTKSKETIEDAFDELRVTITVHTSE